MANAIRLIVGVILFSAALEFATRLLENNPAREWMDVALYIGFTGFLLSQIVLSIQQSENNSPSAYESNSRANAGGLSPDYLI